MLFKAIFQHMTPGSEPPRISDKITNLNSPQSNSEPPKHEAAIQP